MHITLRIIRTLRTAVPVLSMEMQCMVIEPIQRAQSPPNSLEPGQFRIQGIYKTSLWEYTNSTFTGNPFAFVFFFFCFLFLTLHLEGSVLTAGFQLKLKGEITDGMKCSFQSGRTIPRNPHGLRREFRKGKKSLREPCSETVVALAAAAVNGHTYIYIYIASLCYHILPSLRYQCSYKVYTVYS